LKLPVFRQVDDRAGQADPLQPCQGASAVLKLDWQPPAQLLVSLASLANWVVTGVSDGADVAAGAGWDTILRETT
jgi:hypothetical protein